MLYKYNNTDFSSSLFLIPSLGEKGQETSDSGRDPTKAEKNDFSAAGLGIAQASFTELCERARPAGISLSDINRTEGPFAGRPVRTFSGCWHSCRDG